MSRQFLGKFGEESFEHLFTEQETAQVRCNLKLTLNKANLRQTSLLFWSPHEKMEIDDDDEPLPFVIL
jgi:hypothetical protein